MKRSAAVRLTLMTAAVAAGGLSACGDSDVPKPGNYTTLEACIEAGNSSKACSSARDEAVTAHEARAPRFATKEECLKGIDVTDCQETKVKNQDGSLTSMFIPAVAGFAIARAIQQQRQGGGGYYSYYGGSPFYGSRDYPNQYRDFGNLSTSRTSYTSGGAITSTSNTSVATAPSRPPNINTTTVARSGFGSSASFSSGSS